MIQFQNLIPFLTCVVVPAFIAITVMFLPALIELKKPHDAGPRMINYTFIQAGLLCLSMLADIEEKIENQFNFRVAIFPGYIPNIES